METQFSKPKVTIDLEEYDYLIKSQKLDDPHRTFIGFLNFLKKQDPAIASTGYEIKSNLMYVVKEFCTNNKIQITIDPIDGVKITSLV